MQKSIQWLPWEPETFQKAKQEQKPIFLYIDFPSCHWCHAMKQEAFADAEIIQLLTDHFLCIQIDREQRPDIHAIYLAACTEMIGHGGSPITALLNSAQQPFFISTYVSKEELYALLSETIQQWSKYRSRFSNMGEQLTQVVREKFRLQTNAVDIDGYVMEQAVRAYAAAHDPHWGGLGRDVKFPMPHTLLFLLRHFAATKDMKSLHMAELSLLRMCEGGLFDHIGGGFMHYAMDPYWALPSYEKMLPENAWLTQVYIEAWQITGRATYRYIAEKNLSYLLHEMLDPSGGFYSSQDADALGKEGIYYQLTPKEIIKLLGSAEGEAYITYYGLRNASLPNRIGHSGGIVTQRMEALNEMVRLYREERMPIAKDEKKLTASNALMVQTLVQAYLAFDESAYLDAALATMAYIQKKLMRTDGTLFMCWKEGEAVGEGTLACYAQLASAALCLYRATLKDAWLYMAVRLARSMLERFEDKEHGGFFMSAQGTDKLLAKPKDIWDHALPSGNAAALSVLATLSLLDVGEGWSEAANRQAGFISGFLADNPLRHMASLSAVMPVVYPITLVDAQADAYENEQLLAALRSQYTPFLYIKALAPGIHGNAWRLCKGSTCLAPFWDMEALLEALE